MIEIRNREIPIHTPRKTGRTDLFLIARQKQRIAKRMVQMIKIVIGRLMRAAAP